MIIMNQGTQSNQASSLDDNVVTDTQVTVNPNKGGAPN
jgi:hypothetical protein